jgi:hypothetical protein
MFDNQSWKLDCFEFEKKWGVKKWGIVIHVIERASTVSVTHVGQTVDKTYVALYCSQDIFPQERNKSLVVVCFFSSFQEHRVYGESGLQAWPEKDCLACAQCWVQPQAFCCRHHANPRASHNRPHLQLWEDGVHRC